jgi:hypothetical protein
MINKRQKEDNNRICKCGHRKGEHSYIGSCRCLRVMSCECKGFEELKAELGDTQTKHKTNLQ